MKAVIIFSSIQIFLVYSASLLPSEEIWSSVKSNSDQGLMVYNENYFIYDEKNYTKLDIHGEKMNALNRLQNETYIRNNYLSNYIFIIESLNESEQSLEDVADKLSENIKLELDYYNKHNYILAVFVIKSRKVKFYAGTTAIKKITTLEHNKILSDIKYYMTNGEYYKAWTRVIEDYDYYYNNYNGNTNTNTNNNTNNNKNNKSKEESPYTKLFLFLVLVVFFGLIIFCNRKEICNSSSSSGYRYRKRYNRSNDNNDNNDRVSYGRDSDNRDSYDRGSIGGYSVASGGGGGSW